MNYNDIEGKEKYVVSAYEADANRYEFSLILIRLP